MTADERPVSPLAEWAMTLWFTVVCWICRYNQYVSLYEKFRILEEKYGALKKAMNEVLWEVRSLL
jgi:hypothetical protein